ncbi:MAG: citrate synthase [Bacteroidaceae bacterium]|nr:citrate synthase [Bacteroidaceae bacterium]
MDTKNEYVIYKLADRMKHSIHFDAEQFTKRGVKRGLRNADGTGVLVGLTNIGDVHGYTRDADGTIHPAHGQLFYRGYDVASIVHAAQQEGRLAFEEVALLLLSGRLPDRDDLREFGTLVREYMPLDPRTMLHIIELEGHDIMNILARSVLELYTFDDNPDDTSRDNLMRQSVELISKFPTIIAYAYNMLRHNQLRRSLSIRHPQPSLSIAENFLYMLKGKDFTPLEARMLDLLLVVQAEHGGGNNSTFTVRVTSSAGTDTYSSIAAGIGSLKGPLHGGANLQVNKMLRFLKDEVKDWTDDDEISDVLRRIVRGETYDGRGLIYGIGHAVYTLSDPRAELLKELAGDLAREKGREREYAFMQRLEERAKAVIYELKGTRKTVCANVDFYSGFIYELLGFPPAIFTPIFAMARIVGWCAHRNEELCFNGKRIIRPAYRFVDDTEQTYVPLAKRV